MTAKSSSATGEKRSSAAKTRKSKSEPRPSPNTGAKPAATHKAKKVAERKAKKVATRKAKKLVRSDANAALLADAAPRGRLATVPVPRQSSKAAKPGHEATSTARAATPDGRFINRDESWLLFNRRVLEEAGDPTNPLLERVKFLAITASNLDEFVEIRVAGVLQRMEDQLGLPQQADEGGLTPDERMEKLRDWLCQFTRDQAACWNDHLVPELKAAGIRVVRWKQMNEQERAFATQFFHEQVDPLLTPVTLDPSHPFPRVLNKALCLALLLRHKRSAVTGPRGPKALGVVTIPRSLPGLIALPPGDGHSSDRNAGKPLGRRNFLLLDELIRAHIEPMFRGYKILSCAAFRVTRNSNLYMQEEESRSILESVAEELHNRRKGDVVRMEIDASADNAIADRLRDNFELDPWQVFRTEAPVNIARLLDLYNKVHDPGLKFSEFHGRRLRIERHRNIFDELRKGDLLLHHPFDSYNTVEEFIEAAARDPQVISIKQTLYRTSADSPIFGALKEAAQSKDVTVVVELMARFDEASNIRWARELEDAGVQVFHGIFGLKTHCKLALIVRKETDGTMRSYAHLGTGNYNPVTARFYTDISLLSARPELTEAVLRVFRYLTADWIAGADAYRPLEVAPITLAQDLLALIARETEHARQKRPARIIAKMNGLLDVPTIEALYTASQAGVEIDLIVRGMCALRPGVSGLSDRIRVRSIVGRFLEHSRIFWFANGSPDSGDHKPHEIDRPEQQHAEDRKAEDRKAEIFAGSADWMPRNLYERCEVVFPVVDEPSRRRLRDEILEAYLRDNVKARLLGPDGLYTRAPHHPTHPQSRAHGSQQDALSAQDWLMLLARKPERRLSPATPAPPPLPPQDL